MAPGCCCTLQCTAEWRSKEPKDSHQGQGGGERDEVHGGGTGGPPPPEEPGTQHFFLDDDSVPELSGGGRPDPVWDPGPPVVGGERHSGVGFEVLLDVPRTAAGGRVRRAAAPGGQGGV